MAKITWKPGTMVYPLPPAMVSCGTMEKPNIMTVAWTGIINTNPAMTYISIQPSRHSYALIKESGEFVINLTNTELVPAADFCGVKSGRDMDKFAVMGLTPDSCSQVKCPMISESPVSIECRVTEIKRLGSHDMFMAEILAVNVEESLMDDNGRFQLEKGGLAAFSHGRYYALGKEIGKFGFSVEKDKTKKRRISAENEKRKLKKKSKKKIK